ncbi:hypothetical protein [Facilibium subflavum]|uniref:hypothetical protein n=1 Tax=Facilibium subflavum TaxID=2219058 RepID=UPI000E64B0AF|nr:hypothetical protein [Facilibium subflavum]
MNKVIYITLMIGGYSLVTSAFAVSTNFDAFNETNIGSIVAGHATADARYMKGVQPGKHIYIENTGANETIAFYDTRFCEPKKLQDVKLS